MNVQEFEIDPKIDPYTKFTKTAVLCYNCNDIACYSETPLAQPVMCDLCVTKEFKGMKDVK